MALSVSGGEMRRGGRRYATREGPAAA
jgi:hypothetical protein